MSLPVAPSALSTAPDPELRSVLGVCLDIDDTLSTHGKLTAQAFQALWRLKSEGYWVVPVTGRPAGWCDHIARFWPVDAVVGENGAFAFLMKEGRRQRLTTPEALPPDEAKRKLEALATLVLERFPRARWASDQGYRETDLAIDFREDVEPWAVGDVQALQAFCESKGARAKVSSIHVNAWFGDYDKFKGFQHWRSQEPKAPAIEHWLYVGDSPNDEPLFQSFAKSVGVANVKRFLPQMKHAPKYVTASECGAGFSELVDALIRARGGK